jgi:hypothetical protein
MQKTITIQATLDRKIKQVEIPVKQIIGGWAIHRKLNQINEDGTVELHKTRWAITLINNGMRLCFVDSLNDARRIVHAINEICTEIPFSAKHPAMKEIMQVISDHYGFYYDYI